MFAVVRTGGKQYRVAPGDKIVVEKMDGNAGDRVTLGDVLLAGDGGNLKSTDGLSVAAEIIAQAKGEKVTVFKKRRRHNYRRKKGHRQQHTILKIVAIGDQKAEKKPAATKVEAAKPAKDEAPKGKAAEPAKSEAPANEAAAPKAEKPKVEKPKVEKKAAAPKAEKAASTKDAAPAKGGAKKSSKTK